MLQSRRGFLIGAGSLLTAAFVADARSFIRRTSRPLLASPTQVTQTLHWYDCADDGYLLTLGPHNFLWFRLLAAERAKEFQRLT